MPTEKDFEDVLAKYPELIEIGLRLTGRQMMVHGRRLDLRFDDQSKRSLVVELKWGPVTDRHIGQVMAYEGSLLSSDSPDLRVMLIGTRVPPNIRRALEHHGIAWKEIRQADILAFVREKQDL
jgi:RecB family endonuclease NucS